MEKLAKKTGHNIVDKIESMKIKGNVTPDSWFYTLTDEHGKPYLTAITLLGEILYCYRATEKKDSKTGHTIYTTRFAGEMPYKSYGELMQKFNLSRKQVRTALDFLESKKIIKKHIKTATIANVRSSNVMFFEIFPDKLEEITYSKNENDNTTESNVHEIVPGANRNGANRNIDEEPTLNPEEISTLDNNRTELCPSRAQARASESTQHEYTNKDSTLNSNISSANELVELLSPLGLGENEIMYIARSADYDYNKLQRAVDQILHGRKKIYNVVAYLRTALTNDFTPVSYTPHSWQNGFIPNQKQDYDFEAIEQDLCV